MSTILLIHFTNSGMKTQFTFVVQHNIHL